MSAAALFAGGTAAVLLHLRSRGSGMELKMALGTVQLGIEYGAANKTGMPTEEEAIAMIRTAAERGVMSLDTARAYGLSEHRIGKAFEIICEYATRHGVLIGVEPEPANIVRDAERAAQIDDRHHAVVAQLVLLELDRVQRAVEQQHLPRHHWGGERGSLGAARLMHAAWWYTQCSPRRRRRRRAHRCPSA